jgi:ATP-dependent Clp protease, protease subunit
MLSENKEGLDIEAGWARIAADVDRDGYIEWSYKLHLLSRYSRAERLTILFNSDGGDVYYGYAIYDLVRAVAAQRPIDIIANGQCDSSATLILQAATRRLATANTYMLIHFGQETSESAEETAHNAESNKRWYRLFHERTGLSLRMVKKLHDGETYFTTERALKFNIIDEVLP